MPSSPTLLGNQNRFGLWTPAQVDWVRLQSDQDIGYAVNELINSNPVVSGRISRPSGRTPEELKNDLIAVAEKELSKLRHNLDAYGSPPQASRLIQQGLMEAITRHLITEHYLHRLMEQFQPPQNCVIEPGQVWWPASFYVISRNRIFAFERGDPIREFYGGQVIRHPAIVVEAMGDGLYKLIPCSSKGEGRNAFGIKMNPYKTSYAVCNYPFRATWQMLSRDLSARDREGQQITDYDLDALKIRVG